MEFYILKIALLVVVGKSRSCDGKKLILHFVDYGSGNYLHFKICVDFGLFLLYCNGTPEI